jgi:hypothetical protein
MSPEERLKIIKEMQRINEEQVANREKALLLSKELEQDILNQKISMDIKKLEIENIGLHKRFKDLTSKL